jgi:hypothetical protein
MSVKIPINNDILVKIQRQYADIVAVDVKRINDPSNLEKVPQIVAEIQNNLNEFAKQLYDKHGRIIIRVGPDEYDYLDITSPRVKINHNKAVVYFLETNKKGRPAKNPLELEQ